MQDNYLKGSVKHHCSYNVASLPNSGVLTYFDWWHTSVWRCGAFMPRERYSIIRSFKTRSVGGCNTDNWKVIYWYRYQTVCIYSNSNYCQTEFCGRLTSHLAGAMYIRAIAWMPLLWHSCTMENLWCECNKELDHMMVNTLLFSSWLFSFSSGGSNWLLYIFYCGRV